MDLNQIVYANYWGGPPFHAIFFTAARHCFADTFPTFRSLAVISLQSLQIMNMK